jgi:translation initiation factor 2 subunit 3
VIYFAEKTEIKERDKEKLIPEINIGLVGHVDHGKTSLTQALTGKWTDTHSEELKRGITIRLGYADASFYHCEKCGAYGTSQKCAQCFSDSRHLRTVSFLDAPGHETLMATVLSGASLMDGAILVIAADEDVPRPQTAEHLKALDIVGIKNIVIAQNKIDLVNEEHAKKNYEQIKKFIKGTVAEGAPVIPISAVHNSNIDILIEATEKTIPTPKRDLTKDPKFYIARSFDINKPGTAVDELKGGVIGGSLTQGVIKKNDEIEVRPGIKDGDKWIPLKSTVHEIFQAGHGRGEAQPGGLVALQTELDPALTRGDGLSGSIAGRPSKLPPIHTELSLKIETFAYVIGVGGHQKVPSIKENDSLLITAAIAKTVGVVTRAKKNEISVKLKLPICAERGDKVALAMQVAGRWHLIGYGIIK